MKKKKISFPSALTVLFIVLIFAAILTAVVPAGLYSKLTYNADHDVFEITTPEGEVTEMAPTQESLDELGVTGNLNKFLDGSINKPIAVPGTYEKVDQEPQGVFKILLAAISGVYDTIDIILFCIYPRRMYRCPELYGCIQCGNRSTFQSHQGQRIYPDHPDHDYYRSRWNYLRSCRRNHCTLPDPCTGIPCSRI